MDSNKSHLFWLLAACAVLTFALSSGRNVRGQIPTPGQGESMLSSQATTNPVLYSTDVLSLLAQLRSVNLEKNIQIIETSIFDSFDDYTQEVVSEPKGRPNPFDLLPGESLDSFTTVETKDTTSAR